MAGCICCRRMDPLYILLPSYVHCRSTSWRRLMLCLRVCWRVSCIPVLRGEGLFTREFAFAEGPTARLGQLPTVYQHDGRSSCCECALRQAASIRAVWTLYIVVVLEEIRKDRMLDCSAECHHHLRVDLEGSCFQESIIL